MRVCLRFVLLLLLAHSFVVVVWAEPARLALVIGNAAYDDGAALKNPVNDAQDLASALTRAGWQVTIVTDADRRGMNTAVDAWSEQLNSNPDCNALFYYAGHGMQLDGDNYLLPVRVPLDNLSDIKHEALNLNDVTAVLESSKVQVSLVILDACRNNPFAKGSTRAVAARGLSVVRTGGGTKGSAIMFSTSPGDVAQDGLGRNGVFTSALLKQVDSGLRLEDLFKKVTSEVRLVTADQQKPWINASLGSDFYLISDGILQTRAAEAAKIAAAEAQKAAQARQDEIAALTAKVQSAEASKVNEVQAQLEQAKKEAEAAKAAQAKANSLAATLAAEVARPKGKVRFESDLPGTVSWGSKPLGAVTPGNPLFADGLTEGQQEFHFSATGRTETRAALVTSLAYSTVSFGTPIPQAEISGQRGSVTILVDRAQDGVLEVRARMLSASGAKLIPVALGEGRGMALASYIESKDNFLDQLQVLAVGANTLTPGTWLFSAHKTGDTQEAWYQMLTVMPGTMDDLYLPKIGFSDAYQFEKLRARRSQIQALLPGTEFARGLSLTLAWITVVPGTLMSVVGPIRTNQVLSDPNLSYDQPFIFTFDAIGFSLAAISIFLFTSPDPVAPLRDELEDLDRKILAASGATQ